MKLGNEELRRKLEAELGVDAVTSAPLVLASHEVDGKKPEILCSPRTAAQCAAALRLCSEAEAAVIPWGGGTALRIGNLPRQAEVVMELSGLSRLVEHDPANLTVTVESGITLANLQRTLAVQNQFLPFDPPCAARASVGGIVAANLNGPRRMSYGSVRDLVIGTKAALLSGEQIKAGGKVVKNVAGYDMCKLFVGSLGSLGIITEITVRLMPVPQRWATLIVAGSLLGSLQFADQLAASRLLPASVAIINPAAAQTGGLAVEKALAAVGFEGFEESVSRQMRDTEAMAGRIGLDTDSISTEAQKKLWGYLRDFPLTPDRLVYRLVVPRSHLTPLMIALGDSDSGDSPMRLSADPATGTLWCLLEASEKNARRFTGLIALAQERGGHAIMFVAPPLLKTGIDVWGAPPLTLSLMREVKRQFDPKGLLNPGRFLAGL